jgi:dTDP-4-dehydrorhamnose reductase
VSWLASGPAWLEASRGERRPARWLITGASGMLGRDVRTVLAELLPQVTGGSEGVAVTALTRAELDITDAVAVADAVAGHDVVINAAAYTAVDAAEADEASALAVNGDGAGNVALACAKAGAVLLHVSTDYVFGGDAARPYAEDAAAAPRCAYGRSKRSGECQVLDALPDRGYVVRTAWLYGEHGPNCVRNIARRARQGDTIQVVADQHGQPTWSFDLALGLVALGASRPPAGIYHCVNNGATSWYGLARAVFEELGEDPDRVRPTTTDRVPRPARRPAYSVLATTRWTEAGLPMLPGWRAALHTAFETWGGALVR